MNEPNRKDDLLLLKSQLDATLILIGTPGMIRDMTTAEIEECRRRYGTCDFMIGDFCITKIKAEDNRFSISEEMMKIIQNP